MYLHKLVKVYVFIYFIRRTNLINTEDEILREYKLFMVLAKFEYVMTHLS